MSVWLETTDEDKPDNHTCMTDVIFKIECQSLPVDHAEALTDALCKQHPWLKDMAGTGVHSIHVAGSQNGWQRPEARDQPLILSKRTRLKLRIATDDSKNIIQSLKNTSYKVDHHPLKILDGRVSPLQPIPTLLSRYTVYLKNRSSANSESLFEEQVVNDCKSIGYSPTKILCGRSVQMALHGEKISVRSVLLADIPMEHSLALQEKGLGDLRLFGCGLLIPHKDTAAVGY